jgi:PPOX class probable F420-dependent enzyme
MGIPLSPEVKQLIDRPNFAHLGTLMPDGSPQCVPVWVGREGDLLVICTGENSLKAKNTRRDARVALSIIDFTNPYEEAQIRGRVVERRPDPRSKGNGSDLAQIHRQAVPLPQS